MFNSRISGVFQRLLEDHLATLMPHVWRRETASPSLHDQWSQENPALGQCAVTALLIQQHFGGVLLRTVVEGYGSHYYNRLADGFEVDATKCQFPEGTVIPPGELAEREVVLGSERAKQFQTPARYSMLCDRYDDVQQMLEVYRAELLDPKGKTPT